MASPYTSRHHRTATRGRRTKATRPVRLSPSLSGANLCGHKSSNTFHFFPTESYQTTKSVPSKVTGCGFRGSIISATATGYHCFVHEKLSSFLHQRARSGCMPIFGIADVTSSTSSVSFKRPVVSIDGSEIAVVAFSPRQGFFVHQPGLCARPSPCSVVVLLPSTHSTKPWTTRDFFETTMTTTTMRSQTSSFPSSSSSRYSTPLIRASSRCNKRRRRRRRRREIERCSSVATNQSKLFSVSCVDKIILCRFFGWIFCFFSFSTQIKSLKILFVVHQMSHKNVFKIRTKEKKRKSILTLNEGTKKARRRYVLDRSEKKKEHYTHTYIYIYIYIYNIVVVVV